MRAVRPACCCAWLGASVLFSQFITFCFVEFLRFIGILCIYFPNFTVRAATHTGFVYFIKAVFFNY